MKLPKLNTLTRKLCLSVAMLTCTTLSIHAGNTDSTYLRERDMLKLAETFLNCFPFNSNYKYHTELSQATKQLRDALNGNNGVNTIPNDSLTRARFLNFQFENFTNLFSPLGIEANDCPNWTYWDSRVDVLSLQYEGNTCWSWSSDKWRQYPKDGCWIEWSRNYRYPLGSDNVATYTCTLNKGTYILYFEASGGTMTMEYESNEHCDTIACASTQIFFNNDTIDLGLLCPYEECSSYAEKFEVAEDNTEVKLGIRCNTIRDENDGFWAHFPCVELYKVKELDEETLADGVCSNDKDTHDESTYDISGRKLSESQTNNLTKGIYIKNNKKYIVK